MLEGAATRNLDAPTWLWSSVVDLIGIHERAYLEHCRRYALMQEKAREERVLGATDSNGSAATLALLSERTESVA
jgi:hypothetical protein